MTRRTLIRRVLLILGSGFTGLTGCTSRRAGNGPAPFPAGLDLASPGSLSPAETEDLLAFGEILVAGRPFSSLERRYLVEHVADRANQSSAYVAMYRATVNTLERLGGRRFVSLERAERSELVARHRLTIARVLPGEDLGPFPAEMRILRTRAVPDLIGGYYGSPGGWAVVGYETFPGRCGDLTRYTRAEA